MCMCKCAGVGMSKTDPCLVLSVDVCVCAGVAAAKLSPKRGHPPPQAPGDSPAVSRSSSAAGDDKNEAATAEQPPSKRKKCMKWGLLAAGLFALLIVVAVAIAVPVSKQNAAKKTAAAQATGLKGPRGPPLTFKVDVQVPPNPNPGAGPVCGSLFGGNEGKMVEVRACASAAQREGCKHGYLLQFWRPAFVWPALLTVGAALSMLCEAAMP